MFIYKRPPTHTHTTTRNVPEEEWKCLQSQQHFNLNCAGFKTCDFQRLQRGWIDFKCLENKRRDVISQWTSLSVTNPWVDPFTPPDLRGASLSLSLSPSPPPLNGQPRKDGVGAGASGVRIHPHPLYTQLCPSRHWPPDLYFLSVFNLTSDSVFFF